MNVDYGIISFFLLQLFMVAACFWAWRDTRAEIKTLDDIRAVAKEALQKVLDNAERISEIETAPKALLKRFQEVADELAASNRAIDQAMKKITSVDARVSAQQRWLKEQIANGGEEDTDPAPQGESAVMAPPGSDHSNNGLPPGFGKMKGGR